MRFKNVLSTIPIDLAPKSWSIPPRLDRWRNFWETRGSREFYGEDREMASPQQTSTDYVTIKVLPWLWSRPREEVSLAATQIYPGLRERILKVWTPIPTKLWFMTIFDKIWTFCPDITRNQVRVSCLLSMVRLSSNRPFSIKELL